MDESHKDNFVWVRNNYKRKRVRLLKDKWEISIR